MSHKSRPRPSAKLLLAIIAFMLQNAYPQNAREPADCVNPYVGSISPKTGGTSPTVLVPHGALETSPQFTPGIGDAYLADKIFGFPVSVASVMATVGTVRTDPRENASRFDHDLETATPYYYEVLLEDQDIRTEYTVTDHTIYFRFTFPGAASSNILMSLLSGGSIEMSGDNAINVSGNMRRRRNPLGIVESNKVYFHAELSKTPKSFGTWSGKTLAPDTKSQSGEGIGAYASYRTAKGEQVEMKVGVSGKSVDEARAFLVNEVSGRDFEQIKNKAKTLWNRTLGLIRIEGGTEDQRRTFYTALYRTMGRKGNVWDTYRCAYPLQTIIEPAENMKAIREFVKVYEQTGWLPSSGAMIGNHSTPVIVDSYLKGLRDFDVEKAYAGMRKNHMEATMIPWKDQGPITELEKCYFEKGFFPALPVGKEAEVADVKEWRANVEKSIGSRMPYQITWLPEVGVKEWVPEVSTWHRRSSVSVTLEHAYDDWCLAQMARALGKNEDADYFMKRALNYQNLYNPEIGFMAPKSADGRWVEPFDPKLSGGFAGEGYFAECNSWLYTWHVQHDVEGLITLMGGRDKFIAKLNGLFVEQYGMDKPAFLGQFPDMSGLIGLYCQGNEPAFHIPYLYNYAGEPWMTQRRVREIMKLWYNAGPFGLSGDDDGGAMSAWYVFTSMGFYPQCPGRPVYDIGSPIFEKSVINLGGGKTFVVEARNVSEKNKYIQSAMWNGIPLDRPWFEHAELVKGGRLVLDMGSRPNKKWGCAPEAAPPSMSRPVTR